MVWNTVQYPQKAQPVGDPADFIEPVFFDGWNQPVEQPVSAVEYRHVIPSWFFVPEPSEFVAVFSTFGWEQPIQQPVRVHPDVRHQHPSTFFELEPSDLVEPTFFEAWRRPTDEPVLPTEYRHLLPYWFFVAEPSDLTEPTPFDTFGWEQLHQQPMLIVPDVRHLFPFWFAPDFEKIISTDSGVFFESWVQPIQQPVLPIEYRHVIPYIFRQIDPDDFAPAASPVTSPLSVTLANDGTTSIVASNGAASILVDVDGMFGAGFGNDFEIQGGGNDGRTSVTR